MTGAYAYDSLNRRVRAQTADCSAEFVFDQYGRRVSTWNGSTHASTEANIYSDSGPVAIRTGGSTHFEHQNWVGTERLRTAYNGAVETQFTSLPWGDGSSTTGTDSDPYDFAGLDRDQEDQSEHAQFRNYSPAQARWLNPDPFYGSYSFTNPQSFNRYSYALNNPVNFVDPSGLEVIPCPPGSVAIVCVSVSASSPPGSSGNGGIGPPPSPLKLAGGHGGDPIKPASPRRLDPDSEECKALANKIANIAADIQSSTSDLATNPLGLPDAPPFQGAPPRMSVQGHQELLNEKIQNLANRANEYNQKCGGGDPFGGGAAASAPSASPSTAPAISPEVTQGLIVVGEAIIVGGTAILCPECLAVATAFAF